MRALREDELLALLGGLWFDSLSANPLGVTVLPLFADRDQLRQVILNLIQNGLDATAEANGHVVVLAAIIDGRFTLTASEAMNTPGVASMNRVKTGENIPNSRASTDTTTPAA